MYRDPRHSHPPDLRQDLRVKAGGKCNLVAIVGHAAMICAGEWITECEIFARTLAGDLDEMRGAREPGMHADQRASITLTGNADAFRGRARRDLLARE